MSLWWRQRGDVLFARGPPRYLFPEHEGVPWLMPEGIVLIVENDPVRVEADLAAGVVGCPVCAGKLCRCGVRSTADAEG